MTSSLNLSIQSSSEIEYNKDSNGNIRENNKIRNIGIIGSGAFGTSIAINIAHKQKNLNSGKKVLLFVRTEYILIKNNIVYNINEKEISLLPNWYLEAWKLNNNNYTLPKKLKLSDLLKIKSREKLINNNEDNEFKENEWFILNLCSFMNIMKFNPVYLKDAILPENLIAVCSMKQLIGCEGIIFSVPHQFLKNVIEKFRDVLLNYKKNNNINTFNCKNKHEKLLINLENKFSNKLYILNTTKGILKDYIYPSKLFNILKDINININVSVLMGANIAIQVANLIPTETCIAGNKESNLFFKEQFFMSVSIFESEMIEIFELFGALKNIVALSVGLIDGLKIGGNTTSAIFRMGVVEMLKVISLLTGLNNEKIFKIFTTSAGLGDLYVTCRDGRNYKGGYEISEKIKYNLFELKEFNFNLLQGPGTLKLLKEILINKEELKGEWEKLKLFKIIYEFWEGNLNLTELVKLI